MTTRKEIIVLIIVLMAIGALCWVTSSGAPLWLFAYLPPRLTKDKG